MSGIVSPLSRDLSSGPSRIQLDLDEHVDADSALEQGRRERPSRKPPHDQQGDQHDRRDDPLRTRRRLGDKDVLEPQRDRRDEGYQLVAQLSAPYDPASNEARPTLRETKRWRTHGASHLPTAA